MTATKLIGYAILMDGYLSLLTSEGNSTKDLGRAARMLIGIALITGQSS